MTHRRRFPAAVDFTRARMRIRALSLCGVRRVQHATVVPQHWLVDAMVRRAHRTDVALCLDSIEGMVHRAIPGLVYPPVRVELQTRTTQDTTTLELL